MKHGYGGDYDYKSSVGFLVDLTLFGGERDSLLLWPHKVASSYLRCSMIWLIYEFHPRKHGDVLHFQNVLGKALILFCFPPSLFPAKC